MSYYINSLRLAKIAILFSITTLSVLAGCDPAPKNPGNDTPNSSEALVIKDTAYGNHDRNKMDIYLPKNRNLNTKVIFLIHGGAWKSGNKSEMEVFLPLINKYWPEAAVVNINYRLANGSNIVADTLMTDINNAINFIADNNAYFQVSKSFALIGASAGAQLSLLYGYKYDDNNYIKAVCNLYGPSIINDWEWYNSFNIFLGSSIKDILTNYIGTSWDSTKYANNSPYAVVSASHYTPTISFHGTLDPIVPIYQNQWLRSKLQTLALPNEYYEYVDMHGFNATNNEDCIQKTIIFFKQHL